MKLKTVLLALFLGSIFTTADAQKTRADIFTDEEMVFFGIDFSKAKMIGSTGFSDPYEIKNTYFNKWNRLLFSEKIKFDLEKFYHKSKVDYTFDLVDARNDKVNYEELVIDKSYKIEKEDLKSMIAEYSSEEYTEGIGMVYVVESFNKADLAGYIWVTFFDISTKKILMARRMRGKPRGFGLRNFWAQSFYEIMKQTDGLWKKWKKNK